MVLYNIVLLNKSLCAFYVLVIAIIDVSQGKYYIFWYISGFSRFIHRGLSIIFSSGMMISSIALSFLDHIEYKAKIFVFSLHFLVITGFILDTILLKDSANQQLSTRDM